MMREWSVFPDYETNDGNDLTPDRKREVRKEIDYANAIDELETTIQSTIEQSLFHRDGESIQYDLEGVWNRYPHLVMPNINFNDIENDDWHSMAFMI